MSSPGGGKCVWCNEAGGDLRTIRVVVADRFGLNPTERDFRVHPAHESETRAFLSSVCENARLFVGAMLVFVLLDGVLAAVAVALAGAGGDAERWLVLLTGLYTVGIGLFVVRYPFATPETVKWFGLRRARTIATSAGWLTVPLGVWILTLGA